MAGAGPLKPAVLLIRQHDGAGNKLSGIPGIPAELTVYGFQDVAGFDDGLCCLP